MPGIDVRTGQAPEKLSREVFSGRFRERFADPAFAVAEAEIARLEAIAWDAYGEGRKAPVTRPAGPGYADPDYAMSVDWLAAREAIRVAALARAEPSAPSRVVVIVGAARNDGTCPGEVSKTWRLAGLAAEVFAGLGVEVDRLDLSLLSSEYGRTIHPCKACVSTAMPLCHWPCSCYPNHGGGQTNDWMNEIYARLTRAHGILFVTPVYWYQAPSGLKLLIDRLVCADGGNPDPTSTAGKDAKMAKKIELDGWPYPKHLAGRAYGVVVHGDAEGTETLRRILCDWLDSMGLVGSGATAKLDRYIGYYEPYATSHDALDTDDDLQEEVRNAARAVAWAVTAIREGRTLVPDGALPSPRPK